MHYSEAVQQAAAALVRGEDANWELARLTWENTYGPGRHTPHDQRATVEEWCAAVRDRSERRFSTASGRIYRTVWESNRHLGSELRPEWTDAYYAARGSTPTTYAETRQLIERKTIERIEDLATPEQKRAVATRLMADPAVADAIIAQPETRRAVYESLNRQEQRAEVKHNISRASDPVGQRLDRETALIDLEKLLRTFADQTRTLVAAIGALPERSDGAVAPHLFLRQSFVAAEDAIGSVRSLLTTGKSDIDNFLADVLKGGQ